jgi:two-component system LytT family response regulator
MSFELRVKTSKLEAHSSQLKNCFPMPLPILLTDTSDFESEQKEISNQLTGLINDARICLPTQKGFTIIKLDDIVYCEAKSSYTVFRFVNKKQAIISKPLSEYEKLLSENSFLRVHKSYLINLMHVKEYLRGEGGNVVMTDGTEIEVSRRKKEQFLLKVKEYFMYA